MKPKITIVNEQDNAIAYKDRDSIQPEDIYRVSALWVTNSQGQVLLAQRALSKSHDPGKWGPAVAGTVDKGEDYVTNIIKETEEEIGLIDIQPRIGPKKHMHGRHNRFVQWFFLKIDKPAEEFTVQKEEVEQMRWFVMKDLQKDMHDNPEKYLRAMPYYVELLGKVPS